MPKLQSWFDYQARLVAQQLEGRYYSGNKMKINGLTPTQWLIPASHPDIAKGLRVILSGMEIEWITVRPGEEANYIVFLDDKMNKFHETYLAN